MKAHQRMLSIARQKLVAAFKRPTKGKPRVHSHVVLSDDRELSDGVRKIMGQAASLTALDSLDHDNR